MKFLCSFDVTFEMELPDTQDMYSKAWDFVHDNMPDIFCYEGAEMYIEQEDE